jgi:hypothetical protein
LALIKV